MYFLQQKRGHSSISSNHQKIAGRSCRVSLIGTYQFSSFVLIKKLHERKGIKKKYFRVVLHSWIIEEGTATQSQPNWVRSLILTIYETTAKL
jgi:hypothetical protein